MQRITVKRGCATAIVHIKNNAIVLVRFKLKCMIGPILYLGITGITGTGRIGLRNIQQTRIVDQAISFYAVSVKRGHTSHTTILLVNGKFIFSSIAVIVI